MTWTVNQLRALHSELLRAHNYTTDLQAWGRSEHWESADQIDLDALQRNEDCDGFALACRKRLRELDIPNRLVFCEVPNQGFHLVCEVGGYILDNRYKRLRNRDKMNYKWIAISGYEKGDPWHVIKS